MDDPKDWRELMQRLLDTMTVMDCIEEGVIVETLSRDEIQDELKPMEVVENKDSKTIGNLMREPMDVTREMYIIKGAADEKETKRIRDILEKAGPIRAVDHIANSYERGYKNGFDDGYDAGYSAGFADSEDK